MGNKSNQTLYQKEEKSGEVKRLKGQVRALEHEIKRLKSELKTYNKAFSKNIEFLKTKTKNFTLDELIEGAKEELTLEEIGQDKKESFEEMKKKWICYTCNVGIMKIIVVPKGEEQHYFRKCTSPNCKNRTETKLLTEDVNLGL